MTAAVDVLFAGLLAFVLVSAVATALARTLLSTLSAFAAYSLGLAMVWVLFRAPDVALTEAAVGAGVTTALFLLVVRRASDETTAAGTAVSVTPDTPGTFEGIRPLSVAVAALVAVGILLTVPALPAVGDPGSPAFGPVTDYYLTDAADRGIDNVVTAILVVYRGFDTFGEIAVVFAAAVAVLAVLGREVPL